MKFLMVLSFFFFFLNDLEIINKLFIYLLQITVYIAYNFLFIARSFIIFPHIL